MKRRRVSGGRGGGRKQGQSMRLECMSLVLPDGALPVGVFASVGMGLGVPRMFPPNTNPNDEAPKNQAAAHRMLPSDAHFDLGHGPEQEEVRKGQRRGQGQRQGLRVGIRIGNASLKRLLSGAFAGAVSRTAVAPLETIRTHLMVGTSGRSMTEIFSHIMEHEGWTGLFRGNGVNVIRVAPSKAVELFSYDTVKKVLTPQPGEPPRIPLPISPVAGAFAGVCSTLLTYPLELLKTRMTIQRGVYDNLLHAFVKIMREEGAQELYRGLTPSLIGVIPYSASNYFAYESLRSLYKKVSKQEQIGNLETLLIGSAAGAIASSATFPLEVARKHMQVGALSGREVYSSLFHALSSILQKEGLHGLYRGLGPSCMKLVPAAGISFMCYEACKRLLIEEEQL